MRKILKSKINRRILISISKIALVSFGLLAFVGLSGTFAYFTSSSSISGNTVSTGCWVKPVTPDLLSPGNGYMAGSTSTWTSNPYMDWTDSSTTCPMGQIKYQYESYHDVGLTSLAYRSGLLSDSMIPAPGTPDGNYYWRVRAFDGYTWSDWSEVWLLKVDTHCPAVQITNPNDTSNVSGNIEVRGTVTDANPHHYWLVIENSSGVKVAGPGTVNDSTSFTKKTFFNWDTTAVPDGTYTIKLEARDEFGNKCPNQAPVPVDPEDPNDSVDWITVTVDNSTPPAPVSPSPGDVVINEIMWMGSSSSEGCDSSDEWLELRNTTSNPIDISGWQLTRYYSTIESLMVTIPDSQIIPANGYYLISRKTKENSKINVDPDLVSTEIVLSNSLLGLKIYKGGWTDLGNLIDTAGNGSDPLVGEHGNCYSGYQKSMERNDTPEDGTLAENWHVCEDEHCNDTTYWDVEGNNYGTPGAANLSDNDPTSVKNYSTVTTVDSSQEEEVEEEINTIENPEDKNSQENQMQNPPEEVIDNSQKDDEVLEEEREEPALPPEDETQEDNQSPGEPKD